MFVNKHFLYINYRRKYPDKSKCYECGEEGHLSYICPANVLGERLPPVKKDKQRKHIAEDENCESNDDITANNGTQHETSVIKKKRYKKSTYLSDEEEISE